jgi:hypothetical protein
MVLVRVIWLFILAVLIVAAQVNTLRISDEIAPPGGVAQMKVQLTSPQPIPTGRAVVRSKGALAINGIALFSSTGDASGAAVMNGSGADVRFTSTNAGVGTNTDYPILTVAVQVPLDAIPGQVQSISLDGVQTWLSDLLGNKVPLELKPGSLTVGGTLSITNIIPGGGSLPAGATVRVLGMGFTPQTRVQLHNLLTTNGVFLNANQMAVKLSSPAVLDGTRVEVRNPDGERVSYFSYLRGIPAGMSTQPLLARTEPVFSTTTLSEATLSPTVSAVNPDYFTGMAFQNPGAAPVTITVEQYAGKQLTGQTTLTLAPRNRISRTASEWFGAATSPGTYWHIVSSAPIQMVGLLGDTRHATVLPLSVVPVTPGTFQP